MYYFVSINLNYKDDVMSQAVENLKGRQEALKVRADQYKRKLEHAEKKGAEISKIVARSEQLNAEENQLEIQRAETSKAIDTANTEYLSKHAEAEGMNQIRMTIMRNIKKTGTQNSEFYTNLKKESEAVHLIRNSSRDGVDFAKKEVADFSKLHDLRKANLELLCSVSQAKADIAQKEFNLAMIKWNLVEETRIHNHNLEGSPQRSSAVLKLVSINNNIACNLSELESVRESLKQLEKKCQDQLDTIRTMESDQVTAVQKISDVSKALEQAVKNYDESLVKYDQGKASYDLLEGELKGLDQKLDLVEKVKLEHLLERTKFEMKLEEIKQSLQENHKQQAELEQQSQMLENASDGEDSEYESGNFKEKRLDTKEVPVADKQAAAASASEASDTDEECGLQIYDPASSPTMARQDSNASLTGEGDFYDVE